MLHVQWNGDYEAAGTVMTYERVGDRELLKAPGPLKEPLHIMVCFMSRNAFHYMYMYMFAFTVCYR